MVRSMILVMFALLLSVAAVSSVDAAEPLSAGVAKADITPEPGLRMWGYSNRTHGATGTLDPLMAKAVVLRAGGESAAIVTLDLGRPPEDHVLDKIRERVSAEGGIKTLLVTASTTHHARTMESAPGDPNPYADQVGKAIADIICQAAADMVPVRLGLAVGEADFAHNRRHYLPDGRVAIQLRNAEREPTDPVYRQYVVIRLDRADGTPLAVLFHYACHPVVMGGDNYEYSADYVGSACGEVERALDTTCLFLQGACGDINPYMDKTPLDQGGVEETRKMGEALGKLLVATAREPKPSSSESASIRFDSRTIPIPVRWDLQDPQVRAILSRAYGARFDNYLAKTIKNNTIPCVLTTLVVNDALALVGMPGEIFVQFQTQLKRESPIPNTLLVGYTNGYHAYFPTIRDAAAGGYGGKTATYVAPGAGERLTDEGLISLYRLSDQLHDVPRVEDFKLLEYDDVKETAAGQ